MARYLPFFLLLPLFSVWIPFFFFFVCEWVFFGFFSLFSLFFVFFAFFRSFSLFFRFFRFFRVFRVFLLFVCFLSLSVFSFVWPVNYHKKHAPIRCIGKKKMPYNFIISSIDFSRIQSIWLRCVLFLLLIFNLYSIPINSIDASQAIN